MTEPTDNRSSAPAGSSTGSALPEPPRDGFELGAIDVSAERPAHGLSNDRGTRWLVGGLVVGSLVLAGLITIIRGDDDAPSSDGGVELRAVLRDPLSATVAALESVRLDAVTVSAVRALSDAPAQPASTRRSTRADDTATPAATTPRATGPSGDAPREEPRNTDAREPATPRSSGAPAIGDLPPPPPDAAPAEPPSPAPAEPAPAEPKPTVDAAEADEADAPSGV